MATIIEYGGGPSYEIRMMASKKPYGTQLSGYTGSIPGMTYSLGANFPELSHRLVHRFDKLKHSPVGYSGGEDEGVKVTKEYIKKHQANLEKELTDTSRENKYLFDLPPGYTGFIPKYEPNSLGLTFNKVTSKALEEQIHNRNNLKDQLEEIKINSKPSLKAITCDNDVTLGLRKTVTHMKPCGHPSRRYTHEPPIGGYMGWVPRTSALPESYGLDFHRQAAFGLKTFHCYQEYYKDRLSNPRVHLEREVSKYRPRPIDDICIKSKPQYRLYPNDGMIPRYAGIVPGMMFDYGKNYGDSTRSMECCQHHERNFGVHLEKERAKSSVAYSHVIS